MHGDTLSEASPYLIRLVVPDGRGSPGSWVECVLRLQHSAKTDSFGDSSIGRTADFESARWGFEALSPIQV